jgi:predicted chitinase
VKGAGLVGLVGEGVKLAADHFMEDGAAKTAVKTAGSMASYGALGATIGSVVPGVGTVAGAAVGATAGAVIENWDAIKRLAVGASESLTDTVRKIPGVLSGARDVLARAGDSFSGGLSELGDWAGKKFSSGISAATDGLQGFGGGLSLAAEKMAGRLDGLGDAVVKGISTVSGWVASWPAVMASIRDAAKGAVAAVSGVARTAGAAVSGTYNRAVSAAGALVEAEPVASVVDAAKSAFGGGSGGNRDVLARSLPSMGITDPKEQAMFMAQMDHESDGFKKMVESFNYRPERLAAVFPKYFPTAESAKAAIEKGPGAVAEAVYGGRMGNTDPGDGFKFRGRGFPQLTGRDNYLQAGQAVGEDLVANPDRAADPGVSAQIAGWYWKSRGVQTPARAGDVEATTRLINGGLNGLEDRKSKFISYAAQIREGKLRTAMVGGWMGDTPTLVGEREPEILGPDGRIHPTVGAYLSSPGADVAGLAVNTAVKEAARRAGAGQDTAGADSAIAKVMGAAAAAGGKSEELLSQMLEVLRAIAGNTGEALKVASRPATAPAAAPNGGPPAPPPPNIFTLAGGDNRRMTGMSPSMRSLVGG